MTVGERIKELRTSLGLSQVDFADKINVSKQTLYKYENNIITNIPSDKIESVARIGKVSPAYLMGWEPAIKLIANEIKHTSDQTMLYIRLFEIYGYKITLNSDTVKIETKSKKSYIINRKEFMSMIQRCYKDMNYNIERLIDQQTEGALAAAHKRTDIKTDNETIPDDIAIMNNPSEWE